MKCTAVCSFAHFVICIESNVNAFALKKVCKWHAGKWNSAKHNKIYILICCVFSRFWQCIIPSKSGKRWQLVWIYQKSHSPTKWNEIAEQQQNRKYYARPNYGLLHIMPNSWQCITCMKRQKATRTHTRWFLIWFVYNTRETFWIGYLVVAPGRWTASERNNSPDAAENLSLKHNNT